MAPMSAKERMHAFRQGLALDRLPVMMFHGTIGAKLAGLSYRGSNASAQNIAKKVIESYRQYGYDDASITYSVTQLGRSLGSKYKQDDLTAPLITEFLIADVKDYQQVDFYKASFDQDPVLQMHYQAFKLIDQEIGDQVNLTYDLVGPLTGVGSIVPVDRLLRSMRKNKEELHALLQKTTAIILDIINKFAEFPNLQFSISDPISSGDLLAAKQYEEFSLPYTKELVSRIHELDRSSYIHICGDTTRLLSLIADTGVDAISLDQKVSLLEAKDSVGSRVSLIGNIDPVGQLLEGNPDSIEQELENLFDQAHNSPKGFIIAPGCSVPYETPEKNLQAFIDKSKKLAEHYAK